MRFAIAPTLVAYISAMALWLVIYSNIGVGAIVLSVVMGTPRPEYKIKQRYNLHTFFMSVSERHKNEY